MPLRLHARSSRRSASLAAVLLAGAFGLLPGAGAAAPGRPGTEAAPPARFESLLINAPDAAKEAFRAAEEIWSRHLVSTVPIRIRVVFRPLNAKAVTVPNSIRDFPGAPDPETWYPAALADALSGTDLRPGEYDFETSFSESESWHFGIEGEVPEGRVDFITVSLHEIAHGLGFASLYKVGGSGTYYELEPGRRFPPLSFELPDLAGYPSVFDRFLERASGDRLMEARPGGTHQTVSLGMAVLEGEVYFGGEGATRRNGGGRPRLFTTDPSHLDQTTYEESPTDSLMTPRKHPAQSARRPGPIVLGVLEDLGWRVRERD